MIIFEFELKLYGTYSSFNFSFKREINISCERMLFKFLSSTSIKHFLVEGMC